MHASRLVIAPSEVGVAAEVINVKEEMERGKTEGLSFCDFCSIATGPRIEFGLRLFHNLGAFMFSKKF